VRLAVVALALSATVAHADPTGPRPHLLLEPGLRAAWREQASAPHGPVHGAIALCDDARTTHEHDRALYMGAEWAKVVQACLVAWAATDQADHAATAVRYLTALLDDLETIGDHRGGDEAARRDDGYAIRNLGPYTALAYDWLHDAPGMTPELRARARARWKAWLAWYREHGYRAHTAATNYHAGYALAATLIAIAEAGEAGDDGAALWREVVTMWTKELGGALAEGGVLEGGDWPEGWQYGPLSVAELALGARAMKRAGIEVPGVGRWLGAVLRRHVHGLSPGSGVFAGGDTEAETPNLPPNVLVLDAVALGDAAPDDRRWARGELSRLALTDNDFLLYDALAGVGDRPVVPPRAKWPTAYLAAGTGTFYARTRWDDRAVWMVATCKGAIDVDHRHPDAGNFVLSRGKDDLIVDPSPYGTQSTLTSNAPSVTSGQLPNNYAPSQGAWGASTGFDFVTQRASGVAAARCDYSDQYRFQDRRSDIPEALRDLVLLPGDDGTDAILLVVDRADTGDAARAMSLRFRTAGRLALAGSTASATIGATRLVIAALGPRPTLGVPSAKDCFGAGVVRGRCDAARFPVTDVRETVPGPHPAAVHAIAAVDAQRPPPRIDELHGDGWQGVRVVAPREAIVIWRVGTGELSYRVPAGAAVTHVVLDAPDPADVRARRDGDACAVTLAPGGATPARPLVVTLDAQCGVHPDAEATAPTIVQRRVHTDRAPRGGCCDAHGGAGHLSWALALGALILVRRWRAGR
jgi:hypothetical protein